jgi:hypothetical protein
VNIDLFQFRDGFAGRGAATSVCVVRREPVEPILPLAVIDDLFHGYVLYAADDGTEFIGVWGARNASRFRRLLRDRGCSLDLVLSSPPARLKRWMTHGKARVA